MSTIRKILDRCRVHLRQSIDRARSWCVVVAGWIWQASRSVYGFAKSEHATAINFFVGIIALIIALATLLAGYEILTRMDRTGNRKRVAISIPTFSNPVKFASNSHWEMRKRLFAQSDSIDLPLCGSHVVRVKVVSHQVSTLVASGPTKTFEAEAIAEADEEHAFDEQLLAQNLPHTAGGEDVDTFEPIRSQIIIDTWPPGSHVGSGPAKG